MTRMLPHAAMALACVLAWPALALAADTTVTAPIGDLVATVLVPLAQALLTLAVPVLAAVLGRAVLQVAPWAALFISQRRLELMVQAVTDYGLNAVAGATKGKTLTVDVGSAVIAAAVRYALAEVPPRVLAAAGGPEGVARLVFRALHLEEEASEASVLVPALAATAGRDRMPAVG